MRARSAAVLAALCAAVHSTAAQAMDAAALKGAWVGVETGNPLKRALIVENLDGGSGAQFAAHSRIGSTGFHSKQLMLVPATLEGRAAPGVLELGTKTRSLEIVLRANGERLHGVVRYLSSGKEREIVYERAPEALLAKAQFNRIPVARASEITVVYMGTPDCPACRKWEARYRPDFVASEHYKAVRFLVAKGATLVGGVRESHFPERDQDLAQQISRGQRVPVPSFAVALDRDVLAVYHGISAWEHRIEPLARELVAWRGAN